jgi:cysteinyl-tRNA synthetase
MGGNGTVAVVLRLHDTATGQVRELELREPGKLSLYVCGPTVYDVPHIGHARSVLTYDVLRRYATWRGIEVTHVANITDVDDNIINRANREGRTEPEVAAEYEAIYWKAMDALGVERPHHVPHATEYVPRMVELVAELADEGLAYETSDGVYLEVGKVDGYGLLAQQSLDDLRSGARVEANDEKRTPLDFVLWKKAKPDEPSWPSPWGDGRPGWHTECVVMSLDLLGEGFDVHGGGQDLKFPHHENERAQAVALRRPFVRHWVHNGWVVVGGEKMSKSLGNFTNLVDFLDQVDRRAYRLLVLQAHYRGPIEVTRETATQAEASLRRLDDFARRTADLDGTPDEGVLDRFRAAMDDDLDTPAAMALVFETLRAANADLDRGDTTGATGRAAAVRQMLTAVGLELGGADDELDPETAALVARRDEARSSKDWASADAARDELVARGWVVEDAPGGTRVRRSSSR